MRTFIFLARNKTIADVRDLMQTQKELVEYGATNVRFKAGTYNFKVHQHGSSLSTSYWLTIAEGVSGLATRNKFKAAICEQVRGWSEDQKQHIYATYAKTVEGVPTMWSGETW